MRNLTLTLVVFIVSLVSAKASTQVESDGPHSWTIVINPNTPKHYIDSVTTEWKKENIDLKFSKLEYNENGKLVKVKGSVDIKAGGYHARGSFASESLESFTINVDDRPGVNVVAGKFYAPAGNAVS
jgi:hypothetical protein